VANGIFDPSQTDLLRSIRLEASAGTGKTYNLERVVCELISRFGVPLESILVVTFTNKAARELRDRIRKLVAERADSASVSVGEGLLRLQEAKRHFDRASIFTIHGFCQHVLKTWPFESSSPFSQEFLTDHSIVEEGVEEVLYRKFRSIPDYKKDMIRSYFSSGIEESTQKLMKDVVRLLEDGDVITIPSQRQISRVREETKLFSRGQGEIRRALDNLMNFTPDTDRINGIFKELKTGQRSSTAENIRSVWDVLTPGDSLYSWVEAFFNTKSNQAKYLYLLTEECLLEKSKSGKGLGDLSHQEDADLIRGVSALFESLEFLLVPGQPEQTSYFRILTFSFIREIADEAAPLIQEKKELRGARDFSDLISVLSELLEQEPDGPLASVLKRQYRVVLVDEFQDTDLKQWTIFKTLFDTPGHNYFLIGDPKQSIYGFRGADLTVYFDACETVEPENRYSLGTNYRSRRSMVEACNFIFSRLFSLKVQGFHPLPFEEAASGNDKAPSPVDSDGSCAAALQICEIQIESEKPLVAKSGLIETWITRIAGETARLLSGSTQLEDQEGLRCINPGDIAVLMERNQDCEAMQALLGKQGIPSVIFSDRRVLETEEAAQFGVILRALAHPGSHSAAGALLLSDPFGLSSEELQRFREDEQYEGFLLYLRNAGTLCDQGQLIEVFRNFFEEEISLDCMAGKDSWRNRLLRESRGRRACTNLVHLAELFHFEQRQRGLDSRELYDFYLTQLNDPQSSEERQVRLDQDGQAVQILTHHSSKGLEFPIVFFCGAMSDGTMPNPESLGYYWEGQRYRDYLASAEGRKKAALSDWEERKRLYYVAFTRASVLLYLPWFPQSDFCYLTSIYAALTEKSLLIEDDELLETVSLQEMWPFHSHARFLKTRRTQKDLKREVNDRIGTGLRTLAAESPRLFSFTSDLSVPNETLPPSLPKREPVLSCGRIRSDVPFSRRISGVVSFSSLTSEIHGLSAALDDQDRDRRDEGLEDLSLSGALGLTRGADFGNLVHAVLEEMDYAQASQSLESWLEEGLFGPSDTALFLEEQALRHFDQNWWKENRRAFCEMIHQVLNCPLQGVGPLRDLMEDHRKHELEFLLHNSSRSRISLEDWSSILSRGFLKGYIDLIFEKEGKLYIADWKTTVPPGRGVAEDYEPENLKKTMTIHRYDLQAWIYAYALRRYMISINPEFSYERDFGGVYYFFVRGMGRDGKRGVHFLRPSEEELLELMKEGE